ncbi:MAG: hypothetical protein ACLPYS_06250 [Vulcanimicrobiaceae bacterium]
MRNNAAGLTLLALAATLFAFPLAPTSAAIETDPNELYQTMRKAYDEGSAKGWPFASELYYESTVFDAGRAYSLFRSSDPAYGEVAQLAVDVASQLHYNPLTNNDAALWYVLEASNYVVQRGDAQHQSEARALQQRLLAGANDNKVLAQQAAYDAAADVSAFGGDGDARVMQIIADVRAYNLTSDPEYRSMLLEHSADPSTPLVRVPDPEYAQMFAIAQSALAGPGFSEEDRANARAIAYRREHTPELKVIARVSAIPHELRLTRTAPADEYFGNLRYSPLGVHNELVRITKYLDKGWGYRMEADALQVDSSVEDWQKQYPRDLTLPENLLATYRLLKNVGTPKAEAAAVRIKNILLVQYADSREAQQVVAS